LPKATTTMKVSIHSLTFKTIIGILPFERVTKQKVILDIFFEYKFSKKEKDFVDYSHVAKMVKQIMKEEKFELIEDALLYLEKALKAKFSISNLYITITKPNILKNCVVSVGY